MEQVAVSNIGAQLTPITTKRGINLGCGRIILPRERPAHHQLLPEDVYTDTAIKWDNVDAVANEGVNKVVDLFDYPWRYRTVIQEDYKGGILTRPQDTAVEDNAYDVAIAAHLCEHIPHAVTRNGTVTKAYGGWWAWWNELGRVLKPGGVAHVLVPYGPSRGGMIDPTHTRYILPETFSYFAPDENAPFDYALRYTWDAVTPPLVGYTPLAYEAAKAEFGEANSETLWKTAQKYSNAISEFAISLKVNK